MDDIRRTADEYFRKNKLREGLQYFEQQARQRMPGNHPTSESVDYWLRAFQFKLLLGDYNTLTEELRGFRTGYRDFLTLKQYPYLKFLEASVAYYLADYTRAKKLLNNVFGTVKSLLPEDAYFKCEILMLEGKIFWKEGDYIEAIHQYIRVIEIALFQSFDRKAAVSFNILVGKALNLIGIVLNEMRDKENALAFLQLSMEWYDRQKPFIDEQHLFYGILKSDLAYCLLRTPHAGDEVGWEHIEEARKLNKEAKKIFDDIFGGRDNKHSASVLKVEARILKEEKAGHQAICKVLEEKIGIRRRAYGTEKHATIARARNHQTRACIVDKELDKALNYAVEAILAATQNYTPKDIYESPVIDQHLVIISNKELLRALNNKAEILLRKFEHDQHQPDVKLLKAAFSSLQAAIDLSDEMRQGFFTEEAKLIFIEQTRPIQELGMYLLYYFFELDVELENEGIDPSELFEIIQYNKGVLLLESIVEPDRDTAMVRDTQIKNYKELWRAFREVFAKRTKAGARGDDNSIGFKSLFDFFDSAYAFLNEKKRKQEAFQRESRPSEAIFTLEGMRNDILSEKSLGIVSFFRGEAALFGLFINHSEFFVKRLDKGKAHLQALKKNVEEIKQLFSYDMKLAKIDSIFQIFPDADQEARKRMKTASFALWETLLAPFELQKRGVTRLCLLPDEDLWYVPFEALVIEQEAESEDLDYHQLQYLTDAFVVNYHFSIPLLHYLHGNGRQIPKDNVLLFLGHENEKRDNSWNALQDMKKILERSSIKKVALEEFSNLGTIADFFRVIQEFDILFISAHGQVEKRWGIQTPMIRIGQAEYIRPIDIESHARFNPQLVIMDSCFSGDGDMRKGEGMMTLVRSFMLRGVPYLIYAQSINFNDSSWEQLSELFKKLFAENTSISVAEALTQVKRTMSKNPDLFPPTWASLAFIGDQTQAVLV